MEKPTPLQVRVVPKVGIKKQLILDLYQRQGRLRLGVREIRALQAELGSRLGSGHKTSLSYIANVLREAGAQIDFHDRFVSPPMEEPYASRFAGTLRFHDLESAEASLQKLDSLYREFGEASDRAGMSLVRSLVLKGKQRAESLAAGARVSPDKRREKQEIASWFRVWLETPDLFFDWLELRKQSEEFQQLFPNHHGLPQRPDDSQRA